MKTVMQFIKMNSGDKFICNYGQPTVYTLQKFPDFNLWILISEHNIH
jgi:hypothetical protein